MQCWPSHTPFFLPISFNKTKQNTGEGSLSLQTGCRVLSASCAVESEFIECADPLLFVTAEEAFVTEEKGILSRRLATVHKGDTLLALVYDFPVWQVSVADITGWINEKFVEPNEEAQSLGGTAAPALRARAARPAQRNCCRTCRKGKACGDSCIARNKTCSKGPGCACNG